MIFRLCNFLFCDFPFGFRLGFKKTRNARNNEFLLAQLKNCLKLFVLPIREVNFRLEAKLFELRAEIEIKETKATMHLDRKLIKKREKSDQITVLVFPLLALCAIAGNSFWILASCNSFHCKHSLLQFAQFSLAFWS